MDVSKELRSPAFAIDPNTNRYVVHEGPDNRVRSPQFDRSPGKRGSEYDVRVTALPAQQQSPGALDEAAERQLKAARDSVECPGRVHRQRDGMFGESVIG